MSNHPSGPNKTAPNIFYVVLHGLICLIDLGQGEGFLAYLLEMGSQHAYLCGDFLAEQQMSSNQSGYPTYVDLRGLGTTKSRNATLDYDKNAVVKMTGLPSLKSGDARAVLTLPRPDEIRYGMVGHLDDKSLVGDKKILKKIPKRIAGTRVFKYVLTGTEKFESIQLFGGAHNVVWKCPGPPSPDSTMSKKVNVAVLHIYNEPPEEMAGAALHNVYEFNRTLEICGAKLTTNKPAKFNILDQPQIPEGLLPQEVSSLDLRQRFAVELMQQARKSSQLKRDKLLIYLSHFGGGGGTQVCGGANGILGA